MKNDSFEKINTNDIDTNVFKKMIKITILIIILFKIGYEISFVSNPDDSWYVTFQKNILTFAIFSSLIIYISSFTVGEIRDKIVTAVLLTTLYLITRYSYYLLIYFFGLSTSNPIVVSYFVILLIVSIIIMVSRFTQLNLVKSIGWMIGLLTVGFFFVTFSIYGSLKECEGNFIHSNVHDPLKTVLTIYSLWILLIILLFWVEGQDWTNLRQDPKKCSLRYTLLLIIIIAGILLGYAWKRCKGVDKSSEETAIEDEPAWVNTGAHIATIMAWLNVFIGHNFSSAFLGFMSFGILDRCAPKNDIRKTAISSLLIIVLPIIYLIKTMNKIKK